MRAVITFSILCAVLLSLAAGAAAAERLAVFVSIQPQKYFVETIGADRVQVTVMVPPGASPATYEPKPRQMVALSKARLYFAVGVPFEAAWLPKITAANPAMTVVHTEQGIVKLPLPEHADEPGTSETGDSGRHARVPDPHVWLDPSLVRIQADHILAALERSDPQHRQTYVRGHRDLCAQIDAVDRELAALFRDRAGMAFMVFHPSWGYFAHAYGLRQIAIEAGGKEPKPAHLQRLIAEARRLEVRVIFVQPQFSQRSAQAIARAIGAQVVTADPLALDWADNLRRHAANLRTALK